MSDLQTFATTDELSSLLADTNLTVSNDAAELDLAAASQAIRNFARWHIAPLRVDTVRLTARAGLVYLPTLQLDEIVSVTSDGVTLDPATVVFDPDAGALIPPRLLYGRWSRYRGGVVVQYRHGYADVPADLKRLCLELVIRSRAAPTSMTREQTMSSSATPSLSAPNVAGGIVLLPHEEPTVNPYRIAVL